ncbi:MAG: T9SS type A sorting domain-containing protein, partial [bacterium]
IFITGKQNNNSKREVLTIKFNQDGDSLWSRKYSSPTDLSTSGNDIKISENGSVIVLASLDLSADYGLLINLIYDKNGNLVVANEKRTNSSGGGQPAMVIDNYSNIIIAGFDHDYGGKNDIFILGIDKLGKQIDSISFNSTEASNESLSFLESDLDGQIYIVGKSDGDIVTIKLSQLKNHINDVNYRVLNFYPNPLVDISQIELANSITSQYQMKIYDTSGKIISIKKADSCGIFLHRSDFKPGMYIYEINDDNNNYYGKFLVE